MKYFINITNNKLKNNKLKNYSIYIPDYKAISRNIERQKVRKELNLPIKTILCKTNDNTIKRKRKTIKKILETITKIERDYNKDPPNEKIKEIYDLINMKYKEGIEMFYGSGEFKIFRGLDKNKSADKEFKRIKKYSLLTTKEDYEKKGEKNPFIRYFENDNYTD